MGEIETINNTKEIEEIINKKIKGRKLVFTDYYKFGLIKRDISHEKVKEVFFQFEKIIAIEKEKLKKGDIGYELFYKLSGNITFSIATCPKNNKLLIIHAVEYKRNLEKRLKRFNKQ